MHNFYREKINMEESIITGIYVLATLKNAARFSAYTDPTGMIIAIILVFLFAVVLLQRNTWSQYIYHGGGSLTRCTLRENAKEGLFIGVFLPSATLQSQFGILLHASPKGFEITNHEYIIYFVIPVLLSACSLMSYIIMRDFKSWLKHSLVYALLFLCSLCIIPNCVERGTLTLCFSVCSLFILFSQILPRLLPASFTFGELAVISTGLAMIGMHVFIQLANETTSKQLMGEKVLNVTMVLLASTVIVSFILAPIFYCLLYKSGSKRDKVVYSLCFYLGGLLNIGCIFLPAVQITLKANPLAWIKSFIFDSYHIKVVIFYWSILVLVALGVTVWHTHSNSALHKERRGVPPIIVRKFFHFIAFAIYMPGLFWTPHFSRLASGIVVSAFVVLEQVRICSIFPLGDLLQTYLTQFKDDRDCGFAILTHIYLLLGCCTPLWIFPINQSLKQSPLLLALYSGVISLGIGDSMASIVGTIYGQRKWSGSSKTIIGSLSAWISMSFCCLLICMVYEIYFSPELVLRIALINLVVTLMEAKTTQIDNVVLPLSMYGAFAIFLS